VGVPQAGGWWFDAALLTGTAAITAALSAGALLDWDLAIRDWCDTHQATLPHLAARGLNFLGSANLIAAIALVLAVVAGYRLRSVRPLLPVITAFALSYFVVAPLKLFFDRAAPHSTNHDAVRLFADPDGWSYPSGHVVNTVIWYQVLAILLTALLRSFGRDLTPTWRRAIRLGPPIIVTITVTYLGFHWLTDSLAALPLGVVLDRILARIPWNDLPLGSRLTTADWARPLPPPPPRLDDKPAKTALPST